MIDAPLRTMVHRCPILREKMFPYFSAYSRHTMCGAFFPAKSERLTVERSLRNDFNNPKIQGERILQHSPRQINCYIISYKVTSSTTQTNSFFTLSLSLPSLPIYPSFLVKPANNLV